MTVTDLTEEKLREWAAAAYDGIKILAQALDAGRNVRLAGEKYVAPEIRVAEKQGGLPVQCEFPFRAPSAYFE